MNTRQWGAAKLETPHGPVYLAVDEHEARAIWEMSPAGTRAVFSLEEIERMTAIPHAESLRSDFIGWIVAAKRAFGPAAKLEAIRPPVAQEKPRELNDLNARLRAHRRAGKLSGDS